MGRQKLTDEERASRREANLEKARAKRAEEAAEREQRIIAGRADAQVGKEPSERSDRPRGYGFGRWPVEPRVGRVVDGMAHRAHRIRTLGNGQVSRVAAAAFTLLKR